MQTSCKRTFCVKTSTWGRDWHSDTGVYFRTAKAQPVRPYDRLPSRRGSAACQHFLSSQASQQGLCVTSGANTAHLRRQSVRQCAHSNGSSSSPSSSSYGKGPVVVVDNYDSFTYNLCQVRLLLTDYELGGYSFLITLVVFSNSAECLRLLQYLGDLGCEHIVLKNDEKTVEELRALNPRGILLSPGPGQSRCRMHIPWQWGFLLTMIRGQH